MTDSNVVQLKPVASEPNHTAIEILEDALADARAGEIVAVGIASVTKDGSSRAFKSTAQNAITLLGSVRRLDWMINKGIDEAK